MYRPYRGPTEAIYRPIFPNAHTGVGPIFPIAHTGVGPKFHNTSRAPTKRHPDVKIIDIAIKVVWPETNEICLNLEEDI